MKWITHWSTAVLTAALCIWIQLNDGTITETARLKQFDLLQQTDLTRISQDIGVVTIDEAAIQEYGQWPWSRSVIADIVNQLRQDGAGIIVLPILFSETDRLGGDDVLSQTITQNGVVLSQTGTAQTNKNAVPRGVAKIGNPIPYLYEWPGMIGPIPQLGNSAGGVGVLNTVPEIDGVIRRVPLLMRVGEEVYPSLAVETIRVATGAPSYQVKANAGGIEALRVPGYPIIETDANARIWLRWNTEFKQISAADSDFSEFRGKTVIVGATADGIGGMIASPTGTKYNFIPSAITLQTMIDGDQIQRPYWAATAELAITAAIAIVIILLGRFTPYWAVGSGFILLSGGLIYGTLNAWQTHLYLIDITMPLFTVAVVGIHVVFTRFVSEFRQKQAIKKQFAGYASPQVVKILQTNPELIKQGTKKTLTTVMTDLRGFTPLSESFGDDVQGLTGMMNSYMDSISEPVLASDAMIIKYIGDATMHIHNAPIDDDKHATNAIKTVLNMLIAVDKFNEHLVEQGKPEIGMGAGVNTGSAFVGEIGSKQRHSYDVLGDSVNVAARIEGQSKTYGVRVVVGPDTVRLTHKDFFYLKLDNLAVKGKTKPLKIYTVLGLNSEMPDDWMTAKEKHEQMLELYQVKQFDAAISMCDELLGCFGGKMDEYYSIWIERCEFMKNQSLPDNWDGAFVATSK